MNYAVGKRGLKLFGVLWDSFLFPRLVFSGVFVVVLFVVRFNGLVFDVIPRSFCRPLICHASGSHDCELRDYVQLAWIIQ